MPLCQPKINALDDLSVSLPCSRAIALSFELVNHIS